MKQQLIYLPIEALKERYTEEWYFGFQKDFGERYDLMTIDGVPLENDIKVGTFLDINSTTHFKWSQLQQVSKMFHQGLIRDGAIFFFSDIEFWGLESVRLLAQMNNIRVFITGFLHAASYTIEDAFSIAAPYQQYTEVGWIASCDQVFVGSEYHKKAVELRRLRPMNAMHLADRIKVTRNPIFSDYLHPFDDVEKEKQIILCNRFDTEKRCFESLKLIQKFLDRNPDWSAVVTTGRSTLRGTDQAAVEYAHNLESTFGSRFIIKANITKADYHKELAKSVIMVSHSIEENYGYCIAESIWYGAVPLLTSGLSHSEFKGAKTFASANIALLKAEVISDQFNSMPWQPTYLRHNLDVSGRHNILTNLEALT